MNKKLILLLIFILVPQALADTSEQTFPSSVRLQIDTGSNTVNIVIEESNNTYSITNSTNTYTINFKKNITCSNSTQQIINNYYEASSGNISNAINQMSSSCQKIADAYSDTKSYYQPLLDCTTSKSQCEKERDSYKVNSDKVVPLDLNYNNCLNEKKNFESQFTTCNSEKSQLKSDASVRESECEQFQSNSKLYGWGLVLVGVGIVGFHYTKKKKEKPSPLEGMPPTH